MVVVQQYTACVIKGNDSKQDNMCHTCKVRTILPALLRGTKPMVQGGGGGGGGSF
jgi:hypothetical protein